MSEKRNIGNEMIKSMEEALDYVRGKKTSAITHKIEIPDNIDVKSIRKSLNLSRTAFADRFGFSSRTLQHWEQGNRRPHGPAKVLLLLLQREPEVIEDILLSKRPIKVTKRISRPQVAKSRATKQSLLTAHAVSRLRTHKAVYKRKTK